MYDEFENIDQKDRMDGGMPDPDGQEIPTAEDSREAAGYREEETPMYSEGNSSEAAYSQASDEPEFSQAPQRRHEACAYDEEDVPEEPAYRAEDHREAGQTPHSGVVQHQPDSGFYHYAYQNGGQEPGGQDPVSKKKMHKAKKHPNGKRPLWKSFALCAGMAAVFGVVASAAFQVTGFVGNQIAPRETEMTVGTADTVKQSEMQTTSTEVSQGGTTSITQVAANAMPSIVAITNQGVEDVQSMFFGRTYQRQTESAGSGVIVSQNDKELLIATNNHVVSGAEVLSVCFTVNVENDEDAVVSAQIKGTDPEHDLAIVAVNLSDIPEDVKSQIKVIQMGSSSKVVMGQQVIAIGNALGYGQSLTVGYVSALDREVTVESEDGSGTITNNMIQTDAAINGGNSGGALLNTAGELIGINSVKAVSTGVEGMGYAIPIDTAQPILDELMNRETRNMVEDTEKGFMGVTPRDVSAEAKEVYNMPAGAFVYDVQEGSPAETAGLKKGDIITKFDGRTISSSDDLYDTMNYYKAGETVDVIVSAAEGGEYVERTVSVTLGKYPEDAAASGSSQSGNDQSGNELPDGSQQPDGNNGGYGDDYMNPFEQFFNGH